MRFIVYFGPRLGPYNYVTFDPLSWLSPYGILDWNGLFYFLYPSQMARILYKYIVRAFFKNDVVNCHFDISSFHIAPAVCRVLKSFIKSYKGLITRNIFLIITSITTYAILSLTVSFRFLILPWVLHSFTVYLVVFKQKSSSAELSLPFAVKNRTCTLLIAERFSIIAIFNL